ncbi:MAG: type IV secretion system DNA-binding domain-containing protein [Pirellulales bacterium]|nr:type IV secretion system DNA-binding domain-containing protein [Pirellulales bacterium]
MSAPPQVASDTRLPIELVAYSRRLHARWPVTSAVEPQLHLHADGRVEVETKAGRVSLGRLPSHALLTDGAAVMAGPRGDGRYQIDVHRSDSHEAVTYLHEFGVWYRIEYAPIGAKHPPTSSTPKPHGTEEEGVARLIVDPDAVVELFGSHQADLYDYPIRLDRGGRVVLSDDEARVLEFGRTYTLADGSELFLTKSAPDGFVAQLNLRLRTFDRFGEKTAIWVYDENRGWAEVRTSPEPLWSKHQPFRPLNLSQYHCTTHALGTSVILDHIKLGGWLLGDRLPIESVELTESRQVTLLGRHYLLLNPGGVQKFTWGQIVVSQWGNTVQVDFLGYYWERHFAWTVLHTGDEWKEVRYSWEPIHDGAPDGFGRFAYVAKLEEDFRLNRGDLAEPIPGELSLADRQRADQLIASDYRRPVNLPAIRFGGAPLRESHVAQHFFFHGNIGSGKSVFMKELLLQVLERALQDPRVRVLIHDPKGDFVTMLDDSYGAANESLYKIINPFDDRGAAWNISRDLGVLSTRRFADMLFPDDSRDPFWPKISRVLFQAIVETFSRQAESWGLRDVLTACLCCDSLDAVLGQSPGGRRFKRLLSQTRTTKGNIVQTLIAYLDDFVPLACASKEAEAEGRYFSVLDWARRVPSEPPVLLMTGSHQAADVLASYYRGLIRLAADKLLDGPEVENPITWLFIDEAQMMADLDELSGIADKGRSKGLVLVLATMNALKFEQKAAATNEKHAGFLMGLGNKALLRCDSELATWSSKFFGKGWRTKTNLTTGSTLNAGRDASTSASSSETTSDHETDLVPPSGFADLPSGSPEGGFHAFIKSDPEINGGMWKDVLAGDGRQDPLPPPPRNEEHEKTEEQLDYLPEWEAQDISRLRLPPKLLATLRGDAEPEDKSDDATAHEIVEPDF